MRAALGVVIFLSLPACLPDEPEAPVLARTGNVWADCYRRFQPGDDPAADLDSLGAACAAKAGMHPLGEPYQGAEQGAGDRAERLTIRVRRGCYRAFAVGGPGVDDLDLAFYDPAGQLAAGDASRDRWPVVPPRGPLCVEGGVYTVAVAVARGRGDYVLQIWGTPAPTDKP